MSFNFFSWMHKEAASLEKIVEHYATTIKSYVALAMPIVAEVRSEIGAVGELTGNEALIKAGTYLERVTGDVDLTTKFMEDHAGTLVPDLLRAAAAMAASHTHSAIAKLAQRDLDSVIQMAYGAVRHGETL
jgi:hypothetical protein